jgi:hypothetical protein
MQNDARQPHVPMDAQRLVGRVRVDAHGAEMHLHAVQQGEKNISVGTIKGGNGKKREKRRKTKRKGYKMIITM